MSWFRTQVALSARRLGADAAQCGRAFIELSHKNASAAAGAQIAAVWLACGLLMLGAAPGAAHNRDARAVERNLIQLTADHKTDPAEIETAEPTVLRLQDLTPDQARVWNAANPISTSSNPAAKPFHLTTEGMLDEARALDCLTAAVYYEAAYETADGQKAVAQVVLNRLRHPAYPNTVCGVVFQGSERTTGCQFTFTCDGALNRAPNEAGWAKARKVAEAALNGAVMAKVGNATHYHAVYVAPYWSPNLVKVAAIGAHVFYRWTGGWGRPPAFSGAYAGAETESFQIAGLDKITSGTSFDMAAPATPKAAAESAPVVEVHPATTVAAASKSVEIVSATDVGQDAVDFIPADELDWAGRLKERGPSRIAAPSMGF